MRPLRQTGPTITLKLYREGLLGTVKAGLARNSIVKAGKVKRKGKSKGDRHR